MTAATKTIITAAIRADATMTTNEKNRLVKALMNPTTCERMPRLAYTEKQAAEILGVSVPTISRMKRRGELRVCRIGMTNRVTAESIASICPEG